MTLDLSRLPAAPWNALKGAINHPSGFPMLLAETDEPGDLAALEFAAMARGALEIQMRRKWTSSFDFDGWCVIDDECCLIMTNKTLENPEGESKCWPDPITALIEAEKWWVANVKRPGAAT